MNKKVKIYLGAVAIGVVCAGGISVYQFDAEQQKLPSDSPAAVAEENSPLDAVAKAEPESTPEPVMTIPATPNGVLEQKPSEPKDSVEAKENPKTVTKVAATEWRGPTLEDLEKLRSENALLEAQLKNAELKSKIASQGGNSAGHENEGLHAKNPAPLGPRVVMIAGVEKNYRANVVMPSGAAISAGVGTALPGFGVVTAITPNEVIVGHGNGRRSLQLFSSTADGY